MEVKKFTGEIFSNCYVLRCENEFLIIDPSRSVEEIRKNIGDFAFCDNLIKTDKKGYYSSQNDMHSTLHSTSKLICLGVFVTHAHFDHIYFIEEWIKAGAPIFCDKNAIINARDFHKNASFLHKKQIFTILNNILLKENDKIKVGNSVFEVLSTKGHTNCSISLHGENSLFCGDLMFENGYIGRTDLPTGNYQDLIKSLEKIENLPKPLKVYCGHGNDFIK